MTRTATLCGATVNASFAAGTDVARQYTILHAADGIVIRGGASGNSLLNDRFEDISGTAILFDPAPPEDVNGWPIIIDADEQFYFKPDAGRLLGSPAWRPPSGPKLAGIEIDLAAGNSVSMA